MKHFLLSLFFVIGAVFFLPGVPFAEDQDLTLRAMQEELKRAKTLQMEGFEPPYFVSFQVISSKSFSVGARFGAIFRDRDRRAKDIYVELRVGDYTMDSSGKGGFRFEPGVNFSDGMRRFNGPVEDDADALRGQLWLAADMAYKNALAQLLAKKGKKIYRTDPDESERFDDFSREKPNVFRGPDADLNFDKEKWIRVVRELSEELKKERELVESDVRVSAETETRYYVNTEGAVIVEQDALFTFYATAVAFAEDGMKLRHSAVRYAGSNRSVPTEDELMRDIRQMVKELKALRLAPTIDPYSGPAILDSETTGVFFHEAIGHRLEGERMRDTQEGQTFKGKIGKKILADFVTVVDDPTLRWSGTTELNGYYRYDNEGVAAQKVVLVKDGVLKSFLLSRAPIPGFSNSNGHGRSNGHLDPMARMANLIISTSEPVSSARLKEMLIALVKKQGKPFGLILRRSRGGETSTGRVNFQAFANRPTLIYRVDPDTGEETLVRGAELVGTPLVSIGKIVAMDDAPGVFNGFCGAESGMITDSSVAPAALVTEIELQRTATEPKRPPILPPPF